MRTLARHNGRMVSRFTAPVANAAFSTLQQRTDVGCWPPSGSASALDHRGIER